MFSSFIHLDCSFMGENVPKVFLSLQFILADSVSLFLVLTLLILSRKVSTLHSPRSITPKLDVTYLFCRIFLTTLVWELYSSRTEGWKLSNGTLFRTKFVYIINKVSDNFCLEHINTFPCRYFTAVSLSERCCTPSSARQFWINHDGETSPHQIDVGSHNIPKKVFFEPSSLCM